MSKASQCCDIFTEYSIISRHQAPRNFRTELVSPTRARLSWDRAQCSTAYTVAVRSNEVEEQREEQVNELIKEFGGLEPCVEYFYSVKTMVHTQVCIHIRKKSYSRALLYIPGKRNSFKTFLETNFLGNQFEKGLFARPVKRRIICVFFYFDQLRSRFPHMIDNF